MFQAEKWKDITWLHQIKWLPELKKRLKHYWPSKDYYLTEMVPIGCRA